MYSNVQVIPGCEVKQKCLRPWEENCTTSGNAVCDYNSAV